MEVGNYVRNENGLIGKIIGFKGDMIETDNKRLITYKSNHSECKIKERPIDLIQVGDYVNGHLIIRKMYENEKEIPTIVKGIGECYFKEKDIETIVTKEQFEGIEYKVK